MNAKTSTGKPRAGPRDEVLGPTLVVPRHQPIALKSTWSKLLETSSYLMIFAVRTNTSSVDATIELLLHEQVIKQTDINLLEALTAAQQSQFQTSSQRPIQTRRHWLLKVTCCCSHLEFLYLTFRKSFWNGSLDPVAIAERSQCRYHWWDNWNRTRHYLGIHTSRVQCRGQSSRIGAR